MINPTYKLKLNDDEFNTYNIPILDCDAFGKSVFKSSDNAVCNCGPACRFKSDTNVQNNCGLLPDAVPDAVPDAEELLDVDLIRLLNKVIYICIYMIPYNNHNI